MSGNIQFVVSAAIAFAITAVIGPVVIPVLRRIKAGQSIREDGPQSHMVKAGTPTMGGIMMLIAVILTCLIVPLISGKLPDADTGILLMAFVLCGVIGFCDDFVKVVKKRNLGLTARQKLLFQIVIAIIIAVYEAKLSDSGTSVYIPIYGDFVDFGIFYIPFIVFVLVAMVNAVNLTDGLDGLASGCTAIVAFSFTLIGAAAQAGSPAVFTAALTGACLGFLLFNHYPAKVFMGDTGSLALGGALAVAAVLMNIEMILPLAGGIFVIEVLSVIIQVTSYKTRKKRVFKMAPIHHHFEQVGWKETKVVAVFWSATALLCAAAILIL